jgi:hypothetical protein
VQIVYDRKSLMPFGMFRSGVFIAKEMLHRKRIASYEPGFVQEPRRSEASSYVEELDREGVVLLPAYLSGDRLTRLQNAFERIITTKNESSFAQMMVNDDVFCGHPEVTDIAADDFLMEIVGQYYGKPFGLGRAGASRMLPTPPERMGSWQWHHDTRGKQVHIMVLVADTSPDGQRMSYLRRSHKVYYDRYRGESHGSRFEADMVNGAKDMVIECAGPAGTVAIFDSNGLHSGNRNDKQKRDGFIFCYVSHRRHFKPITYPRDLLESLSPAKRQLIAMNPRLSVV